MSTIKTRVPLLQNGQRLDRAEFHERYKSMPSRTKAELIEGIVRMPSPLSNDHGEANFPLVVWIDYYLEKTPGLRGAINASTLLDNRRSRNRTSWCGFRANSAAAREWKTDSLSALPNWSSKSRVQVDRPTLARRRRITNERVSRNMSSSNLIPIESIGS